MPLSSTFSAAVRGFGGPWFARRRTHPPRAAATAADWRVSAQAGVLSTKHVFHLPILKLFDDKFANNCPFSGAPPTRGFGPPPSPHLPAWPGTTVHHLLRHVSSSGVAPGDWLGPTAICNALWWVGLQPSRTTVAFLRR